MFSPRAILALLSLAVCSIPNIVEANHPEVFRNTDIGLFCQRKHNACLEQRPGEPEYDILVSMVIFVLEEQEYTMDTMELADPDKASWVFSGKWELKEKDAAKKERETAREKFEERAEKLEEEWKKEHHDRRLFAQREKEIEELDSFVKDLFGDDYDEEAHSVRRRLYSCSGYCDHFCLFWCGRKGWYNRNLREAKKVQRKLGDDDVCLYHTTLKEFLGPHKSKTIEHCVTDDTLCILSTPCGVEEDEDEQ